MRERTVARRLFGSAAVVLALPLLLAAGLGQTPAHAGGRSSSGEWWIQHYASNGTAIYTWGQNGDIPVTR
jgi:hypothetical protein